MDYLGFLLLCLRALGLPDKHLLSDADYLVGSVLVEDYHVIDVRAVGDKLILLQAGPDEALLAVDIEFLVCLDHLRSLDAVEIAYFGAAWIVGSVFLLDMLKPGGCDFSQVCQVAVYGGNILLHLDNGFLGLVLVEAQDAGHLDVEQMQDIILSHLADKLGIERSQTLVNPFAGLIVALRLLEFLILIDALLNEHLFK